jgi:hypothetical protein
MRVPQQHREATGNAAGSPPQAMIADGTAARATSRGAQRRDEARSGGLGVDGGGERRVNSSRRLAGIDEGRGSWGVLTWSSHGTVL